VVCVVIIEQASKKRSQKSVTFRCEFIWWGGWAS